MKAKASKNNKKYQDGLTICTEWKLFSNFIEDFSKLDDYDNFIKNPHKYRLTLKDELTHYSLNNVYLKELFKKPFPEAYNVSLKEYNQVYNHYQRMYTKYMSYITITDYNEVINYAMGRAAVTFDKSKNILFITFANKVVKNHIINYIRDNKKHLNNYYLSHTVFSDDKDITLIDIIEDYDDALRTRDTYLKIQEFNKNLDYLESNILKGLLVGYNQREISDILNISPIKVSRIVNKLRTRIKEYL